MKISTTIALRFWVGRRINTLFEWLCDVETWLLRPAEEMAHHIDLGILEQWIRKCPPGYTRSELRVTYKQRVDDLGGES